MFEMASLNAVLITLIILISSKEMPSSECLNNSEKLIWHLAN